MLNFVDIFTIIRKRITTYLSLCKLLLANNVFKDVLATVTVDQHSQKIKFNKVYLVPISFS